MRLRVIHPRGLKYGTRRMMAGDEFECRDQHVKFLRKKARPVRVSGSIAPPRESLLTQLRARAESLGIKADRRWGERRLQTEIENVGQERESSLSL